MLILWDTIDAHRWIRINDGQVGREALLHNVAIVDLCNLFRFAVCGWAGITRNNAVNNVSVHSEAQVRLVSVAELRCALVVLSCVRARLKNEFLVRIALQTLAV